MTRCSAIISVSHINEPNDVVTLHNYFGGLLQLMNIFQRVQCRRNNFENNFRTPSAGKIIYFTRNNGLTACACQ